MANESGDMKIMGQFGQIIELVAGDADYNPANPPLKIPALQAQKAAALAAIANLATSAAPYRTAVNARQAAFEELRPIVTRAGNMLKASGADKRIIEDAKTFSRKIAGRRKSAKPKDDPNTPANEANKTHSASQLSYENISGNVDNLIELLANVTGYAPNEPDLKVTGLKARSADLKAKNDAVSSTFAPFSAARGVRDQLLYLSDDCVVNIALLIKAYVRAAFGPDSQLFKQIKGLEFKRPRK
jgi:hypothetical protein